MSELIKREDLENWLRTECYGTDTDEDKEYVIERLRNELPTASPWHRVEDGDFPKNDESVFVYCETTGGIIKSTYHEFVKDGERIHWAFGGQLRKYWMPLPEPPKEDNT